MLILLTLNFFLLSVSGYYTKSNSESVCFVPGECTDSNLIKAEISATVELCLDVCKNTENCGWFTYVTYAGLCEIFENCGLLDPANCADCISGEVNCTAPKCNVPGICQVKSYENLT